MNNAFKIYCIWLLLGFEFLHSAYAKPPWELKIDREGIRVYQQDEPALRQKTSKGLIQFKGQAEQVLQLIQNLSSCKSWVYGCLDAKQLDRNLVQMVFEGPLWFKDRDVVFEPHITTYPAMQQWLITGVSRPMVHANQNYIRVKEMQFSWLITQRNDDVKIIYTLYIDPAIKLKSGVNKYNRDAIFSTLSKLRDLLRQ